MFLWAAVVLYAAVAWRLRVRGCESTAMLMPPGRELAPHIAYWKERPERIIAN
jgi:hypothetical protein